MFCKQQLEQRRLIYSDLKWPFILIWCYYKNFYCGACGFRYQTKKSLRRHIGERHPSQIDKVLEKSVEDAEGGECSEVLVEKPYVCDPCGVRYQSMRSLRRHNDERHPLVKYVNERVVKKSMESGDGDAKQFTCETCGKMYQTSQGLRRHIFDHHSGVLLKLKQQAVL